MKAVEELGISSDVTKCIHLSKYLQSVISGNQPARIPNIEENVEHDDLVLVCFSYGVQFWQKVVKEHSILEVNHCKTVLDYFQRVIQHYLRYEISHEVELKKVSEKTYRQRNDTDGSLR